MGLDRSLIGVVGASSAIFVIFCVLAVIVGCFCLKRARKRRQQHLLEESKREKRDQESHHSAQYMNDTLNSVSSIPARSNGGGSMVHADVMPKKMSHYRPKILEDNMISNGYRVRSHDYVNNQAISTIFVNQNKTTIEADNTNLNYNQTNGFIVKGYMRSPTGNQNGNGGPVNDSSQGHGVSNVYPVNTHPGPSSPVRQDREQLKGRQVIKQSVEMGQDGKLVVARTERQCLEPTTDTVQVKTASEPVASPNKGMVPNEDGQRSTSVTARVVNFSSTENREEQTQTVLRPSPAVTRSHHRQRDEEETGESHDIRFPPLPEEQKQTEEGTLSVGQAIHRVLHEDEVNAEPDKGSTLHAANLKTPHNDNYKVIRREHSSHSPMPEW